MVGRIMRIAVITDIHGNRAALSAVLADVAQHGADRIAILGDIVGYGPDPGFCVDRVARLVSEGAVCVQGNHDAAIDRPDPAMNPVARAAIDWTRTELDAGQRRFLAGLPLTEVIGSALFVHASAQDPADWIYVTNEPRAAAAFGACRARLILCGHVHVPALYSCDVAGRVAGLAPRVGAALPLLPTRRWLAVVGAAGQPRDGLPQAAWALVDLGAATLSFRRVPYDAAATAARSRASGLPESLARRLLTGR